MWRNILAVIVGIIVIMPVVVIFDKLSQIIFHVPDLNTNAPPAEIQAFMAKVPTGAFWVMLIGWMVAPFLGGLIAGWISKPKKMAVPVIVGVLFFLTVLSDLIMYKHPLFSWIIGLWAPIPMAFLGSRLVMPKNAAQ